MTLTHVVVAAALSAVYGWLAPGRARGWILLILSLVAVYWLSPPLTIYYLDFLLPIFAIFLAILIWRLTLPPDRSIGRDDWIALGAAGLVILALSATRYLAPAFRPTPSRPPDVIPVAALLVTLGALAIGSWRLLGGRRGTLLGLIIAIIGLFIVLKTEPLAVALSGLLRSLSGQNPALARASDVAWMGFSYMAFRLIHILRDRQSGVLPSLSLREVLTYVLFFPAVTAGPIDRVERFSRDYRALPEMRGLDARRFAQGGLRIAVGIFKKFVVADTLALVALNAVNAGQFTTPGAGWWMLYAYAFRLYFDFGGYTDIAIGLGILYGIWLPENFNRPYLKPNLAAFWQSWHMTLSNWVRFYVFSPFSRWLLTRKPPLAPYLVVFASQMATMIIIGLWHGVSWTFLIWGIWHGAGLFIHKVWSDRTRHWYLGLREKPRLKQAWTVAGTAITFQYVVLGWVWFALPDVQTAWAVFLKLFGAGR